MEFLAVIPQVTDISAVCKVSSCSIQGQRNSVIAPLQQSALSTMSKATSETFVPKTGNPPSVPGCGCVPNFGSSLASSFGLRSGFDSLTRLGSCEAPAQAPLVAAQPSRLYRDQCFVGSSVAPGSVLESLGALMTVTGAQSSDTRLGSFTNLGQSEI